MRLRERLGRFSALARIAKFSAGGIRTLAADGVCIERHVLPIAHRGSRDPGIHGDPAGVLASGIRTGACGDPQLGRERRVEALFGTR